MGRAVIPVRLEPFGSVLVGGWISPFTVIPPRAPSSDR